MSSTLKSNYIGLAEFCRLAAISDSSILALLAAGELAFSSSPSGGLLIDVSKVSPQLLAGSAFRRLETLSEEDKAIFEEELASLVLREVDDCLRDALELALQWLAEENLRNV